MSKQRKVLVTGGNGMVGKHLQKMMPTAIFVSSSDYDLTSYPQANLMFYEHKPDVVIHLAAKVGGIVDNINKPCDYFEDNTLMNTNMVHLSRIHEVDQFIGILSTCIYPDLVHKYPMTEDMLHLGAPTATNFSYGYAKRSLAVHIDACNKQYGTKYQYLTPCNLYSEHDKWGDNSHFVAALVKKIIIAHHKGESEVKLFGTGEPLRQFMYAGDLAEVIKFLVDRDIRASFNVATEDNLSIREIANIALEVFRLMTKTNVSSFTFDPDKPDGQYRKDVSIKKLLTILPHFEATSLYAGLSKTFQSVMNEQIPI
jgi:GDP-L-fucose synthase